jgi:hypothetical protein
VCFEDGVVIVKQNGTTKRTAGKLAATVRVKLSEGKVRPLSVCCWWLVCGRSSPSSFQSPGKAAPGDNHARLKPHVLCPACKGAAWVPCSWLKDEPNYGKFKEHLANTHPAHYSRGKAEEAVQERLAKYD